MHEYWLNEAEFTAKKREQLAQQGLAMKDGSYPIRNKADLANAIAAFGRAKNKAAVKAWIIKRARALGAVSELPGDWGITEADAEGNPSLDEQAEEIRQAWWDCCREMASDNPWTATGYSSYPVETYEDHIVVRAGEDFWTIPFTRTDGSDGEQLITFQTDAATRVERRWIAVEAEGSEWLVRPLGEADGETAGSEWEVVIIRAGESKNGRIYPEAVLRKAAPLFEGIRVLARADEEHVSGSQKSVKNIVGWIDGVKFANGALRGSFHVSEAADWLRTMLADAWKRGKKDLVGLSIVAEGRGKAVLKGGRRLFEVEEITKASSTDVVFDPAAGGGLVKLVAAEEKEESDVDPKLIAALKKADAGVVRGLLSGFSEADVDAIKAAHPELVEKITEAMALPEPTADPKPDPKPVERVTESEADPEPEEDKIPAALGRIVVNDALRDTKLPEAVQTKVRKQFEGKSFTEAELGGFIKAEVDQWGELERQGLVRSNGIARDGAAGQSGVGMEEAERAKAALDGFFLGQDVTVDGQKVKRYRSFREAYAELTGDKDITGRLENAVGGRFGISEANGGRFSLRLHTFPQDLQDLREALAEGDIPLREAVSSTTFDQALGDSIARAMLRKYSQLNLETYQDLVDVVPLRDFRTQRRVRMGGYGNLPAVAENGAYAALTSPTDEEATYAATKRGGIETISLETIMNDDVGAIRRVPVSLARSAAQTLHEFVFDFLATNPTIYDSVALFHATHANLSTAALSLSELATHRLKMRKQADMSSSKRLGLVPKHLWVPVDLEQTAIELTSPTQKPGTADNDVNVLKQWGLDYTVVDYWTDTNNWFTTADKDQTPLIELGFVGPETPELFTQDMPNVGSMFSNDQLKYKIRHMYGGAVVDYRGFQGAIVP